MLPDPNDRYLPHRRGGLLRAITITIALVAVTVFVGLMKDEIKDSPEFDEQRYRDECYRSELGQYYGPNRTR